MTPEDAHRILEQGFAPWVRALDITITEIGPEGCTMEIPIADNILRIGGIVSGQALAALADTSMVFACFGHLGNPAPVGTVTLDTQFLRPASGDSVVCHAEITRAGKAMIFARARLVAMPSGKDVALATATFAR